MTSAEVIVVGAGVLGLASAAELAARGRSVTVIDPGGVNASSVAAGMIAPAMESVLEDLPTRVVEVLRAARTLWPDFAARQGLDLIEEGAMWIGSDATAVASRLRALGFAADLKPDGVLTADDARVDPVAALERLAAPVARVTGRVVAVDRVERAWIVVLEDGRRLEGADLVLATGVAGAIAGLPARVAAAVASIQPIRGQIAHLSGAGPASAVRTPAGYATPSTTGFLVGASMELGRRDLDVDGSAAGRQVAAVCDLLGLKATPSSVRVGIRGATADGLPLAGALDGVHLALGPRRNGWLLAPLVARIVADGVEGRPPGPHAAALGPDRPR